MTEWQITATTIYCDAVDDDVTIMVFPDWRTVCTGHGKYSGNPGLLQKKSKKLKRELKCEGPLDSRVTSYRDKLMKEEGEA